MMIHGASDNDPILVGILTTAFKIIFSLFKMLLLFNQFNGIWILLNVIYWDFFSIISKGSTSHCNNITIGNKTCHGT